MHDHTDDTETNEQIRSRLEGVNVPMIERYASVGIGLAAAGIGVAAALLGPRRAGIAIGSIVGAVGLALATRGVTGVCPLNRARAKRAHKGDSTLFAGDNQGEGNRGAARSYNEHVRDFIDDDRVEPAARAAAVAIDGPEGPSLRAAEEAGKAPMKPGPA